MLEGRETLNCITRETKCEVLRDGVVIASTEKHSTEREFLDALMENGVTPILSEEDGWYSLHVDEEPK